MNKKIIYSVIFVSLFCLTSLVFSQVSISPPPGVPTDFNALLKKIADAVGGIIAALGAIMLIVAGILYLTSAGSPERIGTAKKALFYAIIGIAIGLAASTIVDVITGIIAIPAGAPNGS